MRTEPLVVAALALLLLAPIVTAAPHDDAKDTASRISTIINQQTFPYERELTLTQIGALGINTTELEKQGTYRIVIKSASYDSVTGLLTLNFSASVGGNQVNVRNPVHWYMPFVITGNNDNQRLSSFVTLMIRFIDERPYGQPENDDTLIVYISRNGYMRDNTAGTFSSIRAAAGNLIAEVGAVDYVKISAYTTENQFDYLSRTGWTFNTSSIGADSTIVSGNITIRASSSLSNLGAITCGLTAFSPANTMDYVNGDFDAFADTEFTDSRMAYPGNGNFDTFTLNAAGLANVNKIGDTTFFLRAGWDIDNSFGGSWASGAESEWQIYGMSSTESNRPKLTVVYTTGGGSAPVAAYSANTTSGYPPFDILFTDSSTNTPTGWAWLFGDGDTASTQNPVHTYDSWIGNTLTKYTVNLTASNAFGSDAENKTEYITAYPLNASFTPNATSGCAPLHVGFTDATGNGTPTVWAWNFGGDGTANTQNPTHVFTTPGTYWVSLNASNACSFDIENKTGLITVSSNTIAADFSADDTSAVTGQTITFTDLSTGGPVDWEWSWGDLTSNGTSQNPTHVYASPGNFTVILTVTNECGGSDVEEKVSYINVSSPTPTPTAGPIYTGTIPNKPIVTGTWTTVPTESIYNWTWPQTGDLLKDIARDLLPEMGSSIGSFLVIAIIIICAGGFLVIFVEGWIRIMR